MCASAPFIMGLFDLNVESVFDLVSELELQGWLDI